MGWGAIFCYNELARSHSHRKLLLLPLGGLFYSVGAVMNVAHWPALIPGVFAAHEIFHLFVISGTTCHVLFMLGVVIPSPEPVALVEHSRLAPPSRRGRFGLSSFSWQVWPNALVLAQSPDRTSENHSTGPAETVRVG
jgi:hypothetical protein